MAIRGPTPKAQARNRNPLIHDWTAVERIPFEGGPDLPPRRANGRAWPEGTRQKWDAWSSMPHCRLWGPSDWSFALDSLELAALLYEGEPRYAAELRNREKTLGTTFDYLRGLRIRYIDPAGPEAPAEVTRLEDYRNL